MSNTELDKGTLEHLDIIARDLEKASGYPYPKGHTGDYNRPFAYGLAIGTIMALRKEWERRMRGE